MRKRMERRWSVLTKQEVQNLADMSTPERYTNMMGWLKGEYAPENTGDLAGKHIKLLFEDEAILYEFTDRNHLRWHEGDTWHEDYYEAVKAPEEEGMYFLEHYVKGSVPPAARTLILDFNTGLVTVVRASIGVPASPIEVTRTFSFGIMAGYEDHDVRHHFTEDLVGTAITWTYTENAPGSATGYIKHIYSSPVYYSYAMENRDGEFWMAANPADYVKINDHMYVFSFIEERQTGSQGVFLINMNTLHDVGSFFSISVYGLQCGVTGAVGKLSSAYSYEICEERKKALFGLLQE